MNTTELPVRPDVTTFVARVRELLGDLSEEDRLELTEGLEADLADQVAEQGGGVLGDPEAYARELRAAAGFEPAARRRLPTVARMSLAERIDAARAWWDGQVVRPRVAPVWEVVAALRPAWWALRGWAAAVLVARLVPGWDDYGLAWLPGVDAFLGVAILVVCLAGSTLVGLGRSWPGARPSGDRGTFARVALLGLNLGAVAALLVVNAQLKDHLWDRYHQGYQDSYVGVTAPDRGVLNRGEQVCNIAAYDAQGQPLVGVQLFDQAGRPLDVRCYGQASRTVPWVLGDVTRWNVFPLGERARPARTPERRADLSDAAFPTPDRATTPEVTNPLLPEPVDVEPRREQTGKKDEDRRDGGVSRR